MNRAEALDRVFGFIESIGLEIKDHPGAEGFIRGVLIANGVLLVDRAVCTPANLLHEAGHVAVMPGNARHLLNGSLSHDQTAPTVDALLNSWGVTGAEWPEVGLWRARMQCGEAEATAWSFAAGLHLGLPERHVIADEDFKGTGRSVYQLLSVKSHYGVSGLAHAGMCMRREFPAMTRWVQKSFAAHDSVGDAPILDCAL